MELGSSDKVRKTAGYSDVESRRSANISLLPRLTSERVREGIDEGAHRL